MHVGARRWVRLESYDYGEHGAYFVTICTNRRAMLFGDPRFAAVATTEWERSSELRAEIALDAFVVMPNHIHGVVWISGDRGDLAGARGRHDSSRGLAKGNHAGGPTNTHGGPSDQGDRVGARGLSPLRRSTPRMQPRSLGSFVAGYKASVTREINAMRGTAGAPVWQRNYYEHVIRDDADLDRVRRYIEQNPVRWAFDRENAAGTPDRAETEFWRSLA